MKLKQDIPIVSWCPQTWWNYLRRCMEGERLTFQNECCVPNQTKEEMYYV